MQKENGDKLALHKMLRVYIEGNIASGKSALIRELQATSHVDTYEEDVTFFNTELENFYTNRNRRNCLALQEKILEFCALIQRRAQNSSNPTSIAIFERSAYSSWCIFGQFYEENGFLTAQDRLSLYREELPGIRIYLKTSVPTCLARAKLRARSEERQLLPITFDRLHEIHEHYLNKTGLPVMPGYPSISPEDNSMILCGDQPCKDIAKDLLKGLHSMHPSWNQSDLQYPEYQSRS